MLHARNTSIFTVNSIGKLTSIADPRPPSNGKVMRLGTKKTGSHFASNVDPGLSDSYSFSPKGKVKSEAKRKPQPASDDGKSMESV